jgi:hypothetical protein
MGVEGDEVDGDSCGGCDRRAEKVAAFATAVVIVVGPSSLTPNLVPTVRSIALTSLLSYFRMILVDGGGGGGGECKRRRNGISPPPFHSWLSTWWWSGGDWKHKIGRTTDAPHDIMARNPPYQNHSTGKGTASCK